MGKVTTNNSNRRSRTPNWSADEKQYLLELIKNRKEVVVTLTNNGPNHSVEKEVAWNEILRELALKFGNKFVGSSIKKVKTQWQNMKRIAREEISTNGPVVESFTKQSVEVCQILDMIQDGVLVVTPETPKPPTVTPNVEIKTERLEDETPNQASGSCQEEPMETTYGQLNVTNNNMTQLESSSSFSEQASEVYEENYMEHSASPEHPRLNKKNASVMTETPTAQDSTILNPFHRSLQEFFRYTSIEKQLKLETLKEERQVARAMRETAELNKIIAEQRLKHLLWLKNQEILVRMQSGDPGAGAGRGGGGGGSIREAGGAFGKMQAAREDEFFYKKTKEQLANLKDHLGKEISFHQEQIKRHEDAIRRHKETMGSMDKKD
ncbi:unnamed protein product [Plutella xylostella]|uniref:Regulatory protein zeste n=1 Tax=Plutella xylostella TaxID=51655 RepID=A0A8S4EQP4_PLUXY|nr:unnamed protein product [Plutella xylostella]